MAVFMAKLLLMLASAGVAHTNVPTWRKFPVLGMLLELSAGLSFMLLTVGVWLVLTLLD